MIKAFKKFWNWGWGIYHKNEEVWNYLISGAFGTVVSIGSYEIARIIGFDVIVSNVISWVLAVIAMYITNKLFVFKVKCNSKRELFNEFISFVAARVFTLVLETIILYVGAEIIKIDDLIVKIVAQVVVVVLNYILSKLWIFKKKV